MQHSTQAVAVATERACDASVTHDARKRACQHCGREFWPKRPWQKFCRARCRQAADRKEKLAVERARVRRMIAALEGVLNG